MLKRKNYTVQAKEDTQVAKNRNKVTEQTTFKYRAKVCWKLMVQSTKHKGLHNYQGNSSHSHSS